MIIYHGSESIVEQPEFGKGKTYNDYGRGFYCTENYDLAGEWACGRNHDGFINRYDFDIAGLNILDLNSESYNILNWLAVLARHRSYWQKGSIAEEAKNYLQQNFYIDVSNYDVVIGYRADDSYFSIAQDFVMGIISVRTLTHAMHLGKLGEQIVLKSPEAFSRIRFSGYEIAEAETMYPKRVSRDLEARKEYRKMRSGDRAADDIFMLDILRGGISHDDPRLR